MRNDSSAQNDSIKWLSTLSGIAALLVFISHLPFKLPYNIMFILGRIGVVVFFLKMGYLSYVSRKKRNGLKYLFNRLVRMYPVYWMLLILMYIINISDYTVTQLLTNLTLFNEFIGYECIIGASWMMPIQVCFFIMIAVIGVKFFDLRKGSKADMYLFSMSILGFMALVTAYLRNRTGINLPTAFFLLFMLGILGIAFFVRINDKEECKLIIPICVFFIFLIPSVYLSYTDMWISYLIAYSLGILLFYIGYKNRIDIKAFNMLGSIGYSFFLGAKIVSSLVFKFLILGDHPLELALKCIIEFVSAVILAYLMTRFVEAPLLNRSKNIENRISFEGR